MRIRQRKTEKMTACPRMGRNCKSGGVRAAPETKPSETWRLKVGVGQDIERAKSHSAAGTSMNHQNQEESGRLGQKVGL